MIKAIILKCEGPTYFRLACPFFLGLILGQFSVAGMWLVINYFTGMTSVGLHRGQHSWMYTTKGCEIALAALCLFHVASLQPSSYPFTGRAQILR